MNNIVYRNAPCLTPKHTEKTLADNIFNVTSTRFKIHIS